MTGNGVLNAAYCRYNYNGITGIYVHIPFCRRKCLYCDFVSFPGSEDTCDQYVSALLKEIDLAAASQPKHLIDTIYIGGGTPTVLPLGAIGRILKQIKSVFKVNPGAEVTVEANPETVTVRLLEELVIAGVNRISLGVQDFSDKILGAVGRTSSGSRAVQAIRDIAAAGIDNLSIDLMFGLPGQTIDGLRQNLELASQLGAKHISVYALTLERGTPLKALVDAGAVVLPDEETESAMYDAVIETMPRLGFIRYEISNYARPGFICRHNWKYWRFVPYLGLGAGAHSFAGGERWQNTADLDTYLSLLAGGESPEISRERLSRETAMFEFAMLALRTTEGLRLKSFLRTFGVELTAVYGKTIDRLKRQGLLASGGDFVRLTETGMKFSNVVFRALLPSG